MNRDGLQNAAIWLAVVLVVCAAIIKTGNLDAAWLLLIPILAA